MSIIMFSSVIFGHMKNIELTAELILLKVQIDFKMKETHQYSSGFPSFLYANYYVKTGFK